MLSDTDSPLETLQRIAGVTFWVYKMYTKWYDLTEKRGTYLSSRIATTQRESRLSIRASEPDKVLLAQAARARRMNMSQFVLESSLDAARIIVGDQTQFRLPSEQWEAFCQRLDAPPQIIPALRQLFSEPDPFDNGDG